MTAVLAYGLSVHHFVSRVGDYAGFAAIIAVAVMVLLLFAHARETAELRRRSADAEDEIELLHQQVEWLRDHQPSGQQASVVAPVGAGGGPGAPVPPPAAATRAGGPGRSVAAGAVAAGAAGAAVAVVHGSEPIAAAPAVAPRGRSAVLGAPVGVAAPPLSSATKLIPPTDQELRAVTSAATGTAVADPPTPAPVTAAAQGNGAVAPDAVDPFARGAGGSDGGSTSPRRDYAASERPRRRFSRTLIAVTSLLVVAIVVVVVIVVGSGGSSNHDKRTAASEAGVTTHHGSGSGTTKAKVKKAPAVHVNPATVTVAVLNGTTTANLAAGVSGKLTAKGFQQGATGNASTQTAQTTVVGYMAGSPTAKDDAAEVATALGLKQTAVQPVSSANQTAACQSTPTNCPDQVIVTVGADLNSDAG